jgi:hypothetical protein
MTLSHRGWWWAGSYPSKTWIILNFRASYLDLR